ncbi:unnamed protein product [Didymodactylos carnosus]|uniref:Uncharacterized protein n=1 Tax=Didymodactylos carnosus TaxID=1234261 RepID=A0A815ZIV4_9BILA|nr:unnamed protein product [Didymodactylos carnosus]CAF4454747.1 unnamed protein product [Didymodactylos carnosus]
MSSGLSDLSVDINTRVIHIIGDNIDTLTMTQQLDKLKLVYHDEKNLDETSAAIYNVKSRTSVSVIMAYFGIKDVRFLGSSEPLLYDPCTGLTFESIDSGTHVIHITGRKNGM